MIPIPAIIIIVLGVSICAYLIIRLCLDEYKTEENKMTKKKTTERYKPIILQEHDAEPRRLKAILDVETSDIYILETTKGFAESMGMTIEEV